MSDAPVHDVSTQLSSRDGRPYAAFILRHLLKPTPPFPGIARAVSETEVPFCGDNWFWADDNAKVLELLGRPDIWRDNPEEVLDVLRFVRSLCDGPFIFRRIAAPRMEMTRNDNGVAEFTHSLMNISCDLARGIVSLGMRFHDGRDARNIVMTGNYVCFSHRGRVFTVDVEDQITGYAIEQTDSGARLIWRSDIPLNQTPFQWSEQRLGTVTYKCTIRASSMFVDLEAALDIEPGLEVSDVVLTFGYDNVSSDENNVRYENIRVAFPAAAPIKLTAEAQQSFDIPVQGSNYWCIAQKSQISGFALAVHSLPLADASIHTLKANCKNPGQLHWVVSEHRFEGTHRGGRLMTGERKIITAGGFYDEPEIYATTLGRYSSGTDSGIAPIDLSISYDYGAEVRAFARCFRSMAGEVPPVLDAGLGDELRRMVDHFHAIYQKHFITPFRRDPSVIFSRSIAFMAFAYADMLEATGEPMYRDALREACEIILTFERQNEAIDGRIQSGFLMGRGNDSLPFVDCHCSCLLALVRGIVLLDEPSWLASIDRGLCAFRLDTVKIFFLVDHKQDVAGVDYRLPDGSRRTLDTFWNFTAGLTLRLFNALQATPYGGLREIWRRHAERLEMIEMVIRHRVSRSLRHRDGTIEILCSMLSTETNSETQPWVALGLMGEDIGS